MEARARRVKWGSTLLSIEINVSLVKQGNMHPRQKILDLMSLTAYLAIRALIR